jgi:hypothetical protein
MAPDRWSGAFLCLLTDSAFTTPCGQHRLGFIFMVTFVCVQSLNFLLQIVSTCILQLRLGLF